MSRYLFKSQRWPTTPPPEVPLPEIPPVIHQCFLAQYRLLSLHAQFLNDRLHRMQQDMLHLLESGATIQPGPLGLTQRVVERQVVLAVVGEPVQRRDILYKQPPKPMGPQ
ncbi:MAG: hypothetical protein FJ295_21360 [Planctomycetes bacterium]|nr:hypothetical protein [Planctomycetota bacterium]